MGKRQKFTADLKLLLNEIFCRQSVLRIIVYNIFVIIKTKYYCNNCDNYTSNIEIIKQLIFNIYIYTYNSKFF